MSEQESKPPHLPPSAGTPAPLSLCPNPNNSGLSDEHRWWNSFWNYCSAWWKRASEALKALPVILTPAMSKTSPGRVWSWGRRKRRGGEEAPLGNLRPTPCIFLALVLAHILSPSGRQAEGALQQAYFTPAFWPLGRPSLLTAGSREAAVGAMGFITHPLPGLRSVSWAACTIWALVLSTLVQWACLISWSQFLLLGVLMKTWSFSVGWILAQELPGNIKMSPGLACT